MKAASRVVWALAAAALTAPAVAENEVEGATTTVGILMFDGVQIIDFAAPYEVFGQARFNVYTVSADGEPVTTAMGLSVNVDYGFDDAPAADILLVPGGDVDATRAHAPTLAWLRARSAPAEQVLSVCTGAFILADAGLLDGGRATTFHRSFDYFAQEFPEVALVRDQRWVESGEVVTSAGLASGVDAALHVVATRLGERKARAIALHLEYDWDPDQGFVRGLMADRHLRMPSAPLQLPDGTDIDTLLAVGDEAMWDVEYRVTSPWSPAQLVAHLTELAQADGALTVIDTEDPLTTAWHYEMDGEPWTLRFAAQRAGDDGAYALKAELRPGEDAD